MTINTDELRHFATRLRFGSLEARSDREQAADAIGAACNLIDAHLSQPQPVAQGDAVGVLSIDNFRDCRSMQNVQFDYTGDLPVGTHNLYATPTIPTGHKVVPVDPTEVTDEWLPPGYSLGHSKEDNSYWPLFEKNYIGNDWYATKDDAKIASWKDSHGRITHYMDDIRRYTKLAADLAASPSAGGV